MLDALNYLSQTEGRIEILQAVFNISKESLSSYLEFKSFMYFYFTCGTLECLEYKS